MVWVRVMIKDTGSLFHVLPWDSASENVIVRLNLQWRPPKLVYQSAALGISL